jgi:hypothetical protein
MPELDVLWLISIVAGYRGTGQVFGAQTRRVYTADDRQGRAGEAGLGHRRG